LGIQIGSATSKKYLSNKTPKNERYINQVWDLIDNFFEAFNIIVVPREFNQQEDSLALVASTFKTPNIPQVKYEIEMRYRPSIQDNIKYWQVFEDDQQIKRFLEVIDEFSAINIDLDEDKGIGDLLEGEVESVPSLTIAWKIIKSCN
jgi:hypothetical protein